MSEERKMGLAWGFIGGGSLLGAFTVNPVMMIVCFVAVAACWSFGTHKI